MRARADARVWRDDDDVVHLCVYHVLPTDPPRYLIAEFARGKLTVVDDGTLEDVLARIPVRALPLACHLRLATRRRDAQYVDLATTLDAWHDEVRQALMRRCASR